MTLADIPLASGIRRLVDGFFWSIGQGLARFRRGGDRSNAPACLSMPLLNRLARLLRFALLIAATQIEIKPTQLRPSRADVRQKCNPLRRPARFALFPTTKILRDIAPPGDVPANFSKVERDPWRTVTRKLDALKRAYDDPAPLVRRMARRLPRQLKIFCWRPPKRPARTQSRVDWDELKCAFEEAWFQLREYRRRRREKEAFACAS